MPRTSSIFSAADDLVIVQCWHAGMSVAQIARILDCKYVSLRFRISQLVLDGIIARDRGETMDDARRYYWPGRAKNKNPQRRKAPGASLGRNRRYPACQREVYGSNL